MLPFILPACLPACQLSRHPTAPHFAQSPKVQYSDRGRARRHGRPDGRVEDHVRTHLVDIEKHPEALNTEAAEQLLDVVRTYLK